MLRAFDHSVDEHSPEGLEGGGLVDGGGEKVGVDVVEEGLVDVWDDQGASECETERCSRPVD